MSRTYRNKARFTHLNETHYIEEQLKKFNIRYDVVHFWLPGMEEKYNEDLAEYEKRIGWFYKGYGVCKPGQPNRWKYRSWKKVLKDFSQEEYDAEVEFTKKQYRKYGMDGTYSETGRNSGYKHACAKEIRNKTKKVLHDIIYEKVDAENVCFPDDHNGKCKIWDFW